MDTLNLRPIGSTGVKVTELAFGGAPIGNFIRPFTDDVAAGMVHESWNSGVRYFDTAPLYGCGLSEYRLGHALREKGRDSYVLSTKVGRILRPGANADNRSGLWVDLPPMHAEYDYTYDGVMRSFEDSLQRLMTDHIDVVYMHDIDVYTHGRSAQEAVFNTAVQDGFKALVKLRDEKVVKAIGVGVNEADVCAEAVRRTDSDVVLLAGRYTLLEQDPLDDLFPLCADRHVSVVLGGVYNSGILATGPRENAKFNYAPAPVPVMDRARAMQMICNDYGVPLAAAALQFAAAHPLVASICIGSRTAAQQAQTTQYLKFDIPDSLWDALRENGLLRADAPVPSSKEGTR